MAAAGGAGNYAVICLGANDYYGNSFAAVCSTSSGTITGLAQTYYDGDYAGWQRPINPGDRVTATDGAITGTVTVSSVLSSSSILLSAPCAATGTHTLTFTPSPTTSNFHAQIRSLIAKCKASGDKVIVLTIPPAANTGSPGSQGLFQANRAVFNADITSMTFDGVGSDPDYLINLQTDPDFATFNAQLYYSDLLHPNFQGNQLLAQKVNNALFQLSPPTGYASERSFILNSVPLLSEPNTFGSDTNPVTLTVDNAITINGTASAATAIAILNSRYSSTGTQIQFESAGTVSNTISTGSATSPIYITGNGVYFGYSNNSDPVWIYPQLTISGQSGSAGSCLYLNSMYTATPNSIIFENGGVADGHSIIDTPGSGIAITGLTTFSNSANGNSVGLAVYAPNMTANNQVGFDVGISPTRNIAFYFLAGSTSTTDVAGFGIYGKTYGVAQFAGGDGGIWTTSTPTDDGSSGWYVQVGNIKAANGNLVFGTAGTDVEHRLTTLAASGTANPGFNTLTGTTATQTLTLPSPATAGWETVIKNQSSQSWTISSASGSQIIPSGTASTPSATVSLSSGVLTRLWSDGTNWNQQ
jgi:lysophospholipase L1-like esterase